MATRWLYRQPFEKSCLLTGFTEILMLAAAASALGGEILKWNGVQATARFAVQD